VCVVVVDQLTGQACRLNTRQDKDRQARVAEAFTTKCVLIGCSSSPDTEACRAPPGPQTMQVCTHCAHAHTHHHPAMQHQLTVQLGPAHLGICSRHLLASISHANKAAAAAAMARHSRQPMQTKPRRKAPKRAHTMLRHAQTTPPRTKAHRGVAPAHAGCDADTAQTPPTPTPTPTTTHTSAAHASSSVGPCRHPAQRTARTSELQHAHARTTMSSRRPVHALWRAPTRALLGQCSCRQRARAACGAPAGAHTCTTTTTAAAAAAITSTREADARASKRRTCRAGTGAHQRRPALRHSSVHSDERRLLHSITNCAPRP
jgi:hypothetical protein